MIRLARWPGLFPPCGSQRLSPSVIVVDDRHGADGMATSLNGPPSGLVAPNWASEGSDRTRQCSWVHLRVGSTVRPEIKRQWFLGPVLRTTGSYITSRLPRGIAATHLGQPLHPRLSFDTQLPSPEAIGSRCTRKSPPSRPSWLLPAPKRHAHSPQRHTPP